MEPANPKTGDDPGRRRIFWWRDDGDMPLSQSSDRKARSIDPANVFGAADADADFIRKLAVAADGFDSSDVPATRKRRPRILLSSGVRPLTREAINGLSGTRIAVRVRLLNEHFVPSGEWPES